MKAPKSNRCSCLEKRELAYESRHLTSAYYVNFIFEMDFARAGQAALEIEARRRMSVLQNSWHSEKEGRGSNRLILLNHGQPEQSACSSGTSRDPEIKYTPKGSAVADLGLAINRSYTNQSGEKVEEVTSCMDVELWGRLAEIAGEYAKKGGLFSSKAACALIPGRTSSPARNAAA